MCETIVVELDAELVAELMEVVNSAPGLEDCSMKQAIEHACAFAIQIEEESHVLYADERGILKGGKERC